MNKVIDEQVSLRELMERQRKIDAAFQHLKRCQKDVKLCQEALKTTAEYEELQQARKQFKAAQQSLEMILAGVQPDENKDTEEP